MEGDPVLQELGAALERDDPALAALLSGPPSAAPRRRHALARTLLATSVAVPLLLAPAVTFGVLAMLLVLASPLLTCWWCVVLDDDPEPRAG